MFLRDLKGKNVYLYGDLRCCKDFAYIFDEMEYTSFLYGEKKELIEDVRVGEENFFIICAFSYEELRGQLEQNGFMYGKEFALAEDFFEELDFPVLNCLNGRKLYVWGAGKMGVKYSACFCNITAFLDSDKNKCGNMIEGVRIIHPDELSQVEWNNAFVIVSSPLYYHEIRKDLMKKGLIESKDFIHGKFLDASDWMRKTFYDTNFYNFCCESVYKIYEVEASGEVSCCCTTIIDGRIGNLLYEEYDDIWNSIFHKIQCLSLSNRTFSFCKHVSCPALINREAFVVTDQMIEDIKYKEFINEPEYMHLSIDPTCNLYCESCRDNICIATGEVLDNVTVLKNKILKSLNSNIKDFFIAGNGEVFLSKTYEEIWRSDFINNAKVIRVLTNGMLLVPKRWEEFYIGKENADIWLYVSIDAAMPKTYEEIRRGGNFEILKKNMEFAAKLRKEGKIKYLRMNFVVQRKNYLEMEQFIQWGLELGCDNVFFTKILNWGTYSDEEFENISMMKNDVPKPELAKILDKEIFKNPIVDIGTIQYEKNRVLPDYVGNYYDWETRDWMLHSQKIE